MGVRWLALRDEDRCSVRVRALGRRACRGEDCCGGGSSNDDDNDDESEYNAADEEDDDDHHHADDGTSIRQKIVKLCN